MCRFRHLALIMITLGIGVMLHEVANTSHGLTGGADGLQGIRTWKFLGVWSLDIYGYVAYTYALIVLFVCFLVARRIVQSPFGLALRGIRENALRMPAIGAPSQAHLRKIYTIAAVMAGIAGAVLAQTTETVSLEVLSFQRSADVLVMLILGGTGRLYGGIIGAIIYMLARDHLSGPQSAILVFLDRPAADRGGDVAAERHPRRPRAHPCARLAPRAAPALRGRRPR